MSIEIKYFNLMGNSITQQEAQEEGGDYRAAQYINNQLKKVDCFEYGILDNGEYYLSPDEELITVLNDFSSVWKWGIFYVNKQIFGQYSVWNWEIYKGLTKIDMGRTVFDNQGREIAYEIIDIISLNVKYTIKYYYLPSVGKFVDSGDIMNFGILDFRYDNDPVGITVDVNLPGFEYKTHIIKNQQNILNHPSITPLFSWDEQSYYHTSQLIPT
jgi:hypothetical protein